ncbi:YugN family protein [Paenibacillus sp. CMAA1364]
MIFENTGLVGLKSDLAYMDQTADKAGFFRWQWEYYRATYEYKIEDKENNNEYFLRMNTRAVEGKLEDPDTILEIEAVFMGIATYPHGLDYDIVIPSHILGIANKKLQQFKSMLEA